MLKFVYLISAFYALTACSAVDKKLGVEEDNLIEEAIEEEILEQTGIEVDFTPQNLV